MWVFGYQQGGVRSQTIADLQIGRAENRIALPEAISFVYPPSGPAGGGIGSCWP
jgi:hypothetical protein